MMRRWWGRRLRDGRQREFCRSRCSRHAQSGVAYSAKVPVILLTLAQVVCTTAAVVSIVLLATFSTPALEALNELRQICRSLRIAYESVPEQITRCRASGWVAL